MQPSQLFSGSKCPVKYILNRNVVDKVMMFSKTLFFRVGYDHVSSVEIRGRNGGNGSQNCTVILWSFLGDQVEGSMFLKKRMFGFILSCPCTALKGPHGQFV